MQDIMNHPRLQNLLRWGLATKDAHGFYKKFGFSKLKNSEIFMEKVNKTK